MTRRPRLPDRRTVRELAPIIALLTIGVVFILNPTNFNAGAVVGATLFSALAGLAGWQPPSRRRSKQQQQRQASIRRMAAIAEGRTPKPRTTKRATRTPDQP